MSLPVEPASLVLIAIGEDLDTEPSLFVVVPGACVLAARRPLLALVATVLELLLWLHPIDRGVRTVLLRFAVVAAVTKALTLSSVVPLWVQPARGACSAGTVV